MYTINESLGEEDITRIVSENIKDDQRCPCTTPSQKYEVDGWEGFCQEFWEGGVLKCW